MSRYAAIQRTQIRAELELRRRHVADARATAHVDDDRASAALTRGGGSGSAIYRADSDARRDERRTAVLGVPPTLIIDTAGGEVVLDDLLGLSA